jgi:hypothetical protein
MMPWNYQPTHHANSVATFEGAITRKLAEVSALNNAKM